MSLVELLAIHWEEWYGLSRAYQDEDGYVLACENFGTKEVACRLTAIASDRSTAIVTPAKWAAQRAQTQKGQA